jgi:hypothetical protein
MANFGLFRGFSEKLFEGELPINLGMVASDFLDADALAFIAAANITNATEQDAIVTLVTNMKLNGIWSKMRAIYPFVGASAASHKFNLKDPRDLNAAFRLSFSTGWNHDNLGLLANGTSTTANTYINLSSFMSNASGSYGVYLNTFTLQGVPVLKNTAGALFGTWRFDRLQSIGLDIWWGNYLGTGIITGQTRGFFQLYKNNSSTTEILNNIVKRQLSTAASTPPSEQLIYGAYDNNSSFSNYISNYTRFLYFGDALTDDEAEDYYNIVQAFQSTLGREV